MKINLSEDRLLLVGTLLPKSNPNTNYQAYQYELDYYGMVLWEGKSNEWPMITNHFRHLIVNGIEYVVIGHVHSNSEKKGSWQTIYLVKKELFYESDWQKFMECFPK